MKKLGILLIAFVVFSCSDDSAAGLSLPTMEEYISSNGLVTQTDPSGVQYIINTIGDGNHPSSTADVSVKYRGFLTDSQVFDETDADPVSFSLNDVIEGWQIAVPLLSRGGEGTFFIPSELAYGDRGTASIPPGADLIFEIELVDF